MSAIGRRAWSPAARPVVAVAGLVRGSGATTVARAVGAELAAREPDGATIVTSSSVRVGGIPLGTPAAARLARAAARSTDLEARAVGRLSVVAASAPPELQDLVEFARAVAPLVIDVGDPAEASFVASLADAVVVVAVPSSEPALAEVVIDSLRRVGPGPVIALNRHVEEEDEGPWRDRHAATLPESRLGARLATSGREAGGDLGRAVAGLIDLLGLE